MATLTGQTVSHYRILGHLGGGGMGVVYKARDLKLDRLVALKFLPPELTLDPVAKERFIHEAKAASALDHQNICVVHDIGETEDGQIFIVMAFYEGETLKKKIERGPLKIEEAIDLAVQVAHGLSKAHEHGIVHRDIKPANIMVTGEGVAKIVDFGLAKLSGRTMLTKTGSTLGTAAYMSPEQARGEPTDHRTDIWSLGAVLFELLTGQLPFRGDHEAAILYSVVNEEPKDLRAFSPEVPPELSRVVNRALKKNVEARYNLAGEMAQDLGALREAGRPSRARVKDLQFYIRQARKPRVVFPLLVLIVGLAALGIWFIDHQAKVRRAREDQLPKIEQLVEGGRDNYIEAFKLVSSVQKYLPDDQKLRELRSEITVTISIKTNPPGAAVFLKEYRNPESPWEYLGITPIERVELPIGFFTFRMEKEGYDTVYAASSTFETDYTTSGLYLPWNIGRVLDRTGEVPARMVRIPSAELGDFLIDRYEVTNREFKEFVDSGGYRRREFWKQKFDKDGEGVSWEKAIKEFVDQTGRPGPATWQAGDYPEGQDSYPVSGVSWYEAAAYAEFAGKSLPTSRHWGIAATGGISPMLVTRGFYTFLAPLSNFHGKGPAPVGSAPGMTGYGIYDMAGNVREWCWNESPKGRIIRGGAWNDATYMFEDRTQASPFDRSPKNGLRCAKYVHPEKIPGSAFEPLRPEETPDFYKVKPVAESIFQVYRNQFQYDKTSLNARVEWKNDTSRDWTWEKVSFDAAYGKERVVAYLFLPRRGTPPYQTVIYFPGSGSVAQKSSAEMDRYWEFDARLSLLVKNGRAVLYPVYAGTFERQDAALTDAPDDSHLYTEFLIRIVKDFRRCIDYLETRPDIDSRKLAFFGFSWGGQMGTIIPAVEDRLKASILAVGGMLGNGLPEARDINYVRRVKVPTLMLNGKYDMAFPYETAVRPMFDLLGTPPADKQQKLYDTDHFIPRNEFTKEALNWLDRYLGPVQ